MGCSEYNPKLSWGNLVLPRKYLHHKCTNKFQTNKYIDKNG